MRKCFCKGVDFVCRICFGLIGNVEGDMILDGDVIEKVTKFSYMRSVLSPGSGEQEAVTERIRSARKKLKDVACMLSKRVVCLKPRGSLCKSCERNVL